MELLALAPLRKTTKARDKLENSSTVHSDSRVYKRIVGSSRAVGTLEYGTCDVTPTSSLLVVRSFFIGGGEAGGQTRRISM